MNRVIIIALALLTFFQLEAQQSGQKIVFDVTSTDSKAHRSTLLMMNVMSKSYPNSVLEVVVYGEALPMLLKNQSTVAKEIELFKNNDNVRFTACEVSMRLLFNVGKEALLPGVGTIENAVPDIVEKQHRGWGYIKVSN